MYLNSHIKEIRSRKDIRIEYSGLQCERSLRQLLSTQFTESSKAKLENSELLQEGVQHYLAEVC